MTEKSDKRTYEAAWAKRASEGISIIVPIKNYDVREEKRLLIPFKKGKIGFLDRQGNVVIEPQYDTFYGNCYTTSDYVTVGIIHDYAYERSNQHPQTYIRTRLGLIDYKGHYLLEPNYSFIGEYEKSIIVREAYGYDYKGRHALLNKKGEVLVPYGTYWDIEPFENGLSRCRNHKSVNGKRIELCGVINEQGEVILECNERHIMPFYGRYARQYSQYLEKALKKENPQAYIKYFGKNKGECEMDCDDDYGTHYGGYSGTYAQDVAGYSDEIINDAFEGDPDAYWNID